MQSRRAFIETFVGRLEPRITLYREMPDRLSWNIAGALERIVAAERAVLATLPPDEEPAPVAPVAPVAAADPDRITWRHPVFNVGGRFNPFAGTYAQQMLASADACDRLGHPEIGDSYRELASRTAVRGEEAAPVVPEQASIRRPRSRSTWSGPNMPPPEPVPFVAGEQMGFAL